MASVTGAYGLAVSFSAVVASWPVQLGSVVVMVLVAAALMDLTMRAFTGQLRRPRVRVHTRTVRARTATRAAEPPPRRRPLQAVALDLRRLGREISLVSAGTPAAHRQGLQAAYDDVLVEAATALEVDHRLRECPPGEEREVERLRLITALVDAGLVVSSPGAHG